MAETTSYRNRTLGVGNTSVYTSSVVEAPPPPVAEVGDGYYFTSGRTDDGYEFYSWNVGN